MEQTVKKAQSELETLKRQIIQLKNEQREVEKPKLVAPARLLATEDDNININPPKYYNKCRMHDCFDYSRCSVTSQFPVYVYPINSDLAGTDASPFSITSYVVDAASQTFPSTPYVTTDPERACLYVVVLGEVETTTGANSETRINPAIASDWLKSLSHWHGDGRNHLLIYLTRKSTTQNPLISVDIGRAIVAQSNFEQRQFRPGFDIVLPTLSVVGAGHHLVLSEQEVDHVIVDTWVKENEVWPHENIPLQVPAVRDYTMSFQGQWGSDGETAYDFNGNNMEKNSPETSFHEIFMNSVKILQNSKNNKNYRIETKCLNDRSITPGYSLEWSLCGTFQNRASILSHSTFTLIPAPESINTLSSTSIFVNRIAEALLSGAIPVIIGTHAVLPFDEFISWEKAAVIIPQARITEMSFLVDNFPHADILALRRQGRILFDNYFSSTDQIFESILAVIRTRLQIPPVTVKDVTSKVVEHESFKVEKRDPAPGDAQSEFGIPPSEPQINSQRFRRNYTAVTLDARENFNNILGPFMLFPSTPTDRMLPSDAKFIGSSDGFRPIGEGEGGTGRVYQESLGGNYPREQFTIVILTYERNEVLLQAIERLQGLPHLNKVVVVWNSDQIITLQCNILDEILAIMEQLLRTQADIESWEDDDPQISYMISAWARMCKLLGQRFVEYLPVVMGPLMKAASIRPEVTMIDSQDVNSIEDDVDGWEFIKLRDQQSFGIKTAGLEEKATACQMLVCYARELKIGFVDYVEEVVKLMVPLLKFYFHDGVRTSAVESIPLLLECAELRGEEYVAQIWSFVAPSLLTAVKDEPDKEVLTMTMEILAKCIELRGRGCFSMEQYQELAQILHTMLNQHFERADERQGKRSDEDYDEQVEETLETEDQDDSYILSKIADILHSLFGAHKAELFPLFDTLLPQYVKLLGPDRPWADKQWSLCVFDDIIEYASPHSVKYKDIFVRPLLAYLQGESPEVRQAASYGVGVMAACASDVYADVIKEALPRLRLVIEGPHGRGSQGQLLQDDIAPLENCISAFGKILRNCPNVIGSNDEIQLLMQAWLSWLPVTEDKEEAVHVYGYVCDLLESNNPVIFGENNCNLPAVITLIADAAYGESLIDSKEVTEGTGFCCHRVEQ